MHYDERLYTFRIRRIGFWVNHGGGLNNLADWLIERGLYTLTLTGLDFARFKRDWRIGGYEVYDVSHRPVWSPGTTEARSCPSLAS